MIPEFGHFALILALLLATIQGTLPLIGAAKRIPAWTALARPVAQGQFLFVAFAFGCLAYSFVSNDFSVLNVATNSNSQLPLHYRIAATWGSHEGSMLLWVFMLGIWTVAVTLRSRHLPDEMVARVLGVMGLVSSGFLLFLLLTSNPFERLFPAAADGRDLNPLLQDPGMVFHPPLLYMGYVGFSVAFSFALAALIGGRLDATWARWSRPWTTLAWCFLTCGIMLGSWWAYYELGWGGWWFWDPVENASFMPWLVGTALVHSLAATEKRGTFKAWTVLLAICAFSLSLLGTFLVRSGVLTSVHAFATDPKRGVFILAFLTIVIGGSLVLFAIRAPKVSKGGRFDSVSRESMLLGNNLLLVVAACSVLLGTLYPLFLDAMAMGKISVGPPYFDTVFVPVMTPLVFLMGVGPLARWKEAKLPDLWLRLRWALAVSLVTALLLPFAAGKWTPMVSFGLLLALWIVATTFVNVKERMSGLSTGGGVWTKIVRQPRSYWGMVVAHLGVAVFIVGVTMVKGYESERDVRMDVGDKVTVGGYTFRFDGVIDRMGPNYRAARGAFDVSLNGTHVETMNPEKRVYNASGMPMTEAAIDPGLFGDLYVSL
ncbi:MAG: heme lyase CcmF/NrfE family subunit, partial [Aromatoleum sp.]|nr:heme lyase CcmF/NrfE family subunit [Aromatoleum sp.]